MKRFFLYILIFFSFTDFTEAQNIPVGAWRYHGYCSSLQAVVAAKDRIYAASPYCLFYIDLEDNSINTLSTVNGFSDINVSALGYYEPLDVLVVGYEDGNLDIVKDDQIVNISDIQRKKMTGSKRINHITFHENDAYLSTDYGMSVLDLKNLEMENSFQNISEAGGALKVYNSTISSGGDSLLIVSAEGVLAGRLSSSVILMDRKNWYLYQASDSLPDNSNNIVLHNDRIYVSVDPVYKDINGTSYIENENEFGLYYKQGDQWVKTDIPVNGSINRIQSLGGKLYVSHAHFLSVIDDAGIVNHFGPGNNVSVQEVALDINGHLWVADAINGLYGNKSGLFNTYIPASVNSGTSFKLYHYKDKMASFYGGYNGSYSNLVSFKGLGVFDESGWNNKVPGINFPYVYDIIDGVYNPYNDTLFIASYGYGLLAHKEGGETKIYNDGNSPLINAVPGAPFIKVGGVDVDEDGNLWVVNFCNPNQPVLHRKSLNNTWTSYVIPSSIAEHVPTEVLADDNGNKWIKFKSSENPGLVVYNENNKGSKYRYFYKGDKVGGLPSLKVLSLDLDKNGALWVGTNNGIAIMYDTYNAFTTDFQIPYFDGFALLEGKEITAIKVDGGNRKWIGTKEGLWLFNPDATEVVSHFTIENSPLISNQITDLEINDVTGEVFVSTMKGLISFRGTATESEDNTFSDVKIFPNPVRENYDGYVSISGLATDSYVKITDVSGKLIYDTQATGGTAVWNGRNYNGEKARTGIYLIFAVKPDGQEGVVGKIAVIE